MRRYKFIFKARLEFGKNNKWFNLAQITLIYQVALAHK